MVFESGSLVLVEYIAKLADGTVIEGGQRDSDSSAEGDVGPKLVSVGDPSYPVMKGLDQALANAEVNTPQTVTVQPADAYGERRRDKVKMLPIRKLEDEATAVGEEVTVGGNKGVVLSTGSGRVRVDFNHKFAGKSVTFEFTVLKHLESDVDKVLALLMNAGMLIEYDMSRLYNDTENYEDDFDEDLDAELDDDLEAELDKDLGLDDESKDEDLETPLDDGDLGAELDKTLEGDLGLDDKEEDLEAEQAKDLDEPNTDDESKDEDPNAELDKDLEDILGLDDDDLDDDDIDLDDKDLEDLDDDLDDDDLEDLDDDLDDDDLEDLDDDLDDDDLEDLDDDLDDDDLEEEQGDPYANIPGHILANNVLTVAVPSSMYRSPDIQNKKFVLQMDIFKFVPNLKEVRFLETHQNIR